MLVFFSLDKRIIGRNSTINVMYQQNN